MSDNAEALLSILCDALDEKTAVEKALDDWPFESPFPPTLLQRKLEADDRLKVARQRAEWTVNSFRSKTYVPY